MVTKRRALPYNVVVAAQRRIIRAFSNGVRVYLSMSGGKDSIVLADLIYKLAREGRVDPSRLVVVFVDEEAIFGEVERIVRDWRKRFLALGAEFRWYCIEVKHFNCFNQLSQDESFICWDSTKRDVWCRPVPAFAITDHPRLRRREENYQTFLPRIMRDGIRMAGVRSFESIQRLNSFDQRWEKPEETLFQPIFDWRDTDVWRYIRDEELDFPETYLQLYQTGSTRRQMRISQFFSVDTARTLVKMDEYEPDLLDRIIDREPNAYLAALYWDTEMFGQSGGKGQTGTADKGEQLDYRAESMAILGDRRWPVENPGKASSHRILRSMVARNSLSMTEKHWREVHNILIAGDPKQRAYRALLSSISTNSRDTYEREQREKHV